MKRKPNTQTPIPISDGGTGSTDSTSALTNLGAAPDVHDHYLQNLNGLLPVHKGGTGTSGFGGPGRILKTTGSGTPLTSIPSGQPDDVLTLNSSSDPVWESPAYLQGPRSATQVAVWVTGSPDYTRGYTGLTYNTTDGLKTDKLRVDTVPTSSGGSALYRKTTGELYHLSSLAELKEEITPLKATMDELMKMKPVEFDWRSDVGLGRDIGLIAEEVEEQFPLAATYLDEDSESKLNGVKYDRAWLPMLAGVQDFYSRFTEFSEEAMARIEKMEERIQALEGADHV